MSDYYFFIYIKDKNNVTAVFPKRVSAVVLQCGRVGEKKRKAGIWDKKGEEKMGWNAREQGNWEATVNEKGASIKEIVTAKG